MQVFHFTSTFKTRDNLTPPTVLIVSELQKAMKMLSLFSILSKLVGTKKIASGEAIFLGIRDFRFSN